VTRERAEWLKTNSGEECDCHRTLFTQDNGKRADGTCANLTCNMEKRRNKDLVIWNIHPKKKKNLNRTKRFKNARNNEAARRLRATSNSEGKRAVLGHLPERRTDKATVRAKSVKGSKRTVFKKSERGASLPQKKNPTNPPPPQHKAQTSKGRFESRRRHDSKGHRRREWGTITQKGRKEEKEVAWLGGSNVYLGARAK